MTAMMTGRTDTRTTTIMSASMLLTTNGMPPRARPIAVMPTTQRVAPVVFQRRNRR
jgi:hypothetical protein